MIKRIKQIEDIFSRTIDVIMTTFFIVIFLIVFALVLLRYIFSKSLFGGAELVTVLFIYASALGAALLFRDRKHIRISFFIEHISVKARKFIIIFSYACNMCFHVLLIYFAKDWIQATGQYKTAILKIPYGVMQYSISIYAAIVILYVIRNMILVMYKEQYLDDESLVDYEACNFRGRY